MVYQFKSGSRFSGDAEAVYREIESIGEYRTPREVWQKARLLDVDMPITEQTFRVLFEGLEPHKAVQNLLSRRQRRE